MHDGGVRLAVRRGCRGGCPSFARISMKIAAMIKKLYWPRTFVAAAFGFLAVTAVFASPVSREEPRRKNVIVFVADGRGFSHMEAASIYQFGWPGGQAYQNFPIRLAAATFSYGGAYDPLQAWGDFEYVRQKPTDSAAGATAISTGTITRNGRVGVGPDGEQLVHIADRARARGMSTGVVSSVQISHATPPSFATHHETRKEYAEIARKMIEESQLDLIMGAGHPLYDNSGRRAEEPDFQFIGGEDLWNQIVAGEAGGERPWTFVQTRDDFLALINGSAPERVLGIAPVRETLQYFREGEGDDVFAVPFNETVPTLKEMTLGALNVLSRDPDGFFLHVEGGAVDWAAHRSNLPRMIEEHIGFDEAIEAVIHWIEENSSWEETLVVVTSDHETGYLTGPESGPDARPMWQPLENRGKGRLPGAAWNTRGHTNQLVPLFARGAGAERFHDHIIDIDPKRGPYVHLTAVSKVCAAWLAD